MIKTNVCFDWANFISDSASSFPLVIICLIVVFVHKLLLAKVLVVWPNQYRSEGMMYVRLGRGALGGEPTATDKSFDTDPMKINAGAEVISRSITPQEEVSNGFSSVRQR